VEDLWRLCSDVQSEAETYLVGLCSEGDVAGIRDMRESGDVIYSLFLSGS